MKNRKIFVNDDILKYTMNDIESESNQLIERSELEEKMYQTIELLPPKCKEVFKLNKFEGLKYSQIAENLNLSVKTVEAHITKAFKFLHENFTT